MSPLPRNHLCGLVCRAHSALGDAVFVANARLDYGKYGVNSMSCLGGDFDSDGSFTLNDAAQVAEAQFGMAYLPWHAARRLANPQQALRPLTPLKPMSRGLGVTMKKLAGMQAYVYVSSGAASSTDDKWKALSVQFSHGKIASVRMNHGVPGQITSQHATSRHGDGSLFHAAELGGSGLSWPAGLAATVTFEAGTDMDTLHVDYESMNTYVVRYEDPVCVPVIGRPCPTLVHFGKGWVM